MVKRKEKKDLENKLSILLRLGLILSTFTIALGGFFLLSTKGFQLIDRSTFTGEPIELKSVQDNFLSAISGDPPAIIQFGIILLIATPITRVLACAILFAKQKDLLYVGLSCFVLAILLYSFIQPIEQG